MSSFRILIALCLFSHLALADEIVLVDGRYLHIERLRADEQMLTVRNLATGGELSIPWPLIREEYRKPLMVLYGYAEDEEAAKAVEEGVRLVTSSGDEYLGVPVDPLPAQEIPAEFSIWNKGRKVTFKKEVVRVLEAAEVPALEAFTADQLYQRKTAAGLPADDDVEGHLALAKYSMAIEHYEKAVLHLLKLREIDQDYRPEYVANHLQRMEALSREKERTAAIRAAKSESVYNRFPKAIAILDDLLSIGDLSPAIRGQAEMTKEAVLKARWEYYKRIVRNEYFSVLGEKCRALSRDIKLTLKDARQAASRKLHDEILKEIATRHGLDPKKEVQKLLEERVVNSPQAANYGSGSFIVLGQAPGAQQRQQALEQASQRALAEQQARNRNQSGNQFASLDSVRIPKPPTPDEWWKATDSSSRADWLKAYFAEYGKVLTLEGGGTEDCSRCGASGTVMIAGSQGENIPATCPRCHGHRTDRRVRFR